MSNITKVEVQYHDYNTSIRYYVTDELHSHIRQAASANRSDYSLNLLEKHK